MPYHIAQLAPSEEIFSWASPDEGTLHFAVTQLNAMLDRCGCPVHELGYPHGFDDWLVANRGVCEERSHALNEDELATPVTVLVMDNGSTLLVDGTHRTHRMYRDGYRKGRCRMVPSVVWRDYIVSGIAQMSEDEILSLPTDGLFHRARR